jgi:hypothetical protein
MLVRRRHIVLLTLGSLAIIFGSCGSAKKDAHARLPFGVVDVPHAGETLREMIPVGGWALSDAGIKSVSIYVDRNYVMDATTGVGRPDVAKAFPSIPNNEHAGWNAAIDTRIYTPGAHELTVQAIDNNGAARDLGSLAVTITH